MNFTDFATITLASYQLDGFIIDKHKALAVLSKEIEADFESLNSIDTLNARLQNFAIEETEAADYKEHYVELTEHKKIICGIRHLGGNVDKPFVQLLTNFRISKADLIKLYKSELAHLFVKFQPLFLNYYSKSNVGNNGMGLCYMVQQASEIKAIAPFDTALLLELLSPVDDSYYNWYKESYKSFHAKHEKLKDKVPCNSLEEMEESRKYGLLKEVYFGGKCIGIIAALPENFIGNKGVYFIEIHIKEKYRGKGLAKAIQYKFVKELVNEDSLVWGTIDVTNLPSLKTALSLNRKPVRYENFIAIS